MSFGLLLIPRQTLIRFLISIPSEPVWIPTSASGWVAKPKQSLSSTGSARKRRLNGLQRSAPPSDCSHACSRNSSLHCFFSPNPWFGASSHM